MRLGAYYKSVLYGFANIEFKKDLIEIKIDGQSAYTIFHNSYMVIDNIEKFLVEKGIIINRKSSTRLNLPYLSPCFKPYHGDEKIITSMEGLILEITTVYYTKHDENYLKGKDIIHRQVMYLYSKIYHLCGGDYEYTYDAFSTNSAMSDRIHSCITELQMRNKLKSCLIVILMVILGIVYF